jgi:hypothetical protein
MQWSEIQGSYPFFWMWLNAWLKSKGADDISVLNDCNSQYVKVRFSVPQNEYVKVRFSVPQKVRELSDDMLHEMLEEAWIRVVVDFNSEDLISAWRYIIYKNGLNGLWTQTYTSTNIFKKRSSAINRSLMHAISEQDRSLKKQNSVEQY